MLRNFTDLEIRVRGFANRVTNKDEGATMVEYALLVALIAIVLIAAITILSTGIGNVFKGAANSLTPTP